METSSRWPHRTVLVVGLFLGILLLVACDLIMPDAEERSPFDCGQCVAGLHDLDSEMVADALAGLLDDLTPNATSHDPLGHRQNLELVVDRISQECPGVEAELLCYACIYTNPPQSELLVTMDSIDTQVTRILDIATPDDARLVVVRVHRTAENHGRFTRQVIRHTETALEAELLRTAEAVIPPRDSVLASASAWLHPAILDSQAWFYDRVDGVNIPYAVTTEAIAYYTALIDSLAAHPADNLLVQAKFTYEAEVTFQDTYTFTGTDPCTREPLPVVAFSSVYVANMVLYWDHQTRQSRGLSFQHERRVVLDTTGTVQQVFLDGCIPVGISMPETGAGG